MTLPDLERLGESSLFRAPFGEAAMAAGTATLGGVGVGTFSMSTGALALGVAATTGVGVDWVLGTAVAGAEVSGVATAALG